MNFVRSAIGFIHLVDHNNGFFTLLKRFLEQAGFTVIEESLDPYYAATGIRRLLHSAYFAFHRLFFGLFQVNRYDTIWMTVRKGTA